MSYRENRRYVVGTVWSINKPCADRVGIQNYSRVTILAVEGELGAKMAKVRSEDTEAVIRFADFQYPEGHPRHTSAGKAQYRRDYAAGTRWRLHAEFAATLGITDPNDAEIIAKGPDASYGLAHGEAMVRGKNGVEAIIPFNRFHCPMDAFVAKPTATSEANRPDTASVLDGLKDFQRATVDYVFNRFYGPDPTRRFLVADEVGLGKTMVARGVIARTIEHRWEQVGRIDIVYICSNGDIARQNVSRLQIPGCEINAESTRLTLLPLQLQHLASNRINFVALTPGTSFEQDAYGGRIEERVLLYWLLDRAWGIHGARSSIYVMQDYASTASFERAINGFDPSRISETIAAQFTERLEARIAEDRKTGTPDLKSQFEELREIFCRSDSRPPEGASKRRTRWIGELRRLLARVCLGALEPDLIILDEFQRFKHLLEQESEAGELARLLFESDSGQGARVMLLSATPYRGLTLHHETDDDHYADFLKLLQFLEDGDATGCQEILAEFRDALPTVETPEGLARLRCAKGMLEARLRRVIARTERLEAENNRGGMVEESSSQPTQLEPADVRAFVGTQRIAEFLDEGDMVEYWKSAPYLFNFMEDYTAKKAFREAVGDGEMIRLARQFPEVFLDLEAARAYRHLKPANARLRNILEQTVDRGMWRLLWLPPTLPYYQSEGPFAAPELSNVTKRLVFSAWHMVPRAVASLVSYEAERRMMRASCPRGGLSHEDWKKQRGLLRFGFSSTRLSGLPLLLLVYPSVALARCCDPLSLASYPLMTAAEVRCAFATRVRELLTRIHVVPEAGGNADERWYWLAPMLLDFENDPRSKCWWLRPQLAQIWAGEEEHEEDAGWPKHVAEAARLLEAVRTGSEKLGPQPDDLADVLALAGSAAPAIVTLRAFTRTGDCAAEAVNVRDWAARTGRSFLSLFNHPEVIEMIRAEYEGEPYWLRVLEYSHAGGLQAVIDEYVHLLRESLGVVNVSVDERLKRIASEIREVVTLRTASIGVDEITAPPYVREVKIEKSPMHIRFAMRFGDERSEDEVAGTGASTRKERVRAAFNSPFWPFVLVSTSVGQEGLDFHQYCHALSHWNLPSNPVDLEQREGRIHRFKGHAVRKNLAAAYRRDALRPECSDPWETLFDIGRSQRPPSTNDLVPFWLFPGEAKIERHVPVLPFSRDTERYQGLRRALVIYRMVFGQSRQEDLIAFLMARLPESDCARIVRELRVNLTPPSPC